MFYDALSLRAYAAELTRRFPLPWFVQKISQVAEYDFLLAFRLGPKQNLRLLLSLQPNQPALRWWRGSKPQASVPSSFTMQCRKHLQGRSLDRLESLYPERALKLVGREYSLILELMERQPNLVLVTASGLVAGAFRLKDRGLRLRRPYTLPSRPDLPDASTLSAYQWEELFLEGANLNERTFGLSKAACARLDRLMRTELPLEERIQTALGDFWKLTLDGYAAERLANGRLSIWGSGAARGLLDLEQEQAEEPLPALEAARQRTLQRLKKGLSKLQQRLGKLDEDKAKLAQAGVLQRQGELLLTYQHQVARGADHVQLTDWDGETVHRIALDPALPVAVQARKLMKRASKYRRSAPILSARVAQTYEEIARLQEAVFSAEQAETLEDLEEPKSAGKLQRPQGSGPRRYQLNGFTFLVGRSPRQNDELIRKHSARDDLWFHVKDSPGAHVLLKTAGRSPEEAVVEAAAQLAAHYSSRAKDSRVLVSFTSAQRVKKPAGAAPGLVVYSDELTLWVNPSERNANVLRSE
ncbi:MAG: NFACT family protein [Candidatus Eremiobacteraeota bacterium]|nr:NFACT family protein [Candidatus Eremiobacteraeota bacterium]MCW5871007.1 NFACT family protein [Candidatus Eremiobacteraeota bacterium]